MDELSKNTTDSASISVITLSCMQFKCSPELAALITKEVATGVCMQVSTIYNYEKHEYVVEEVSNVEMNLKWLEFNNLTKSSEESNG